MLVRMWQNWNLPTPQVGMSNGAATTGNGKRAVPMVKHRVTTGPGDSPTRCIPKRSGNTSTRKSVINDITPKAKKYSSLFPLVCACVCV